MRYPPVPGREPPLRAAAPVRMPAHGAANALARGAGRGSARLPCLGLPRRLPARRGAAAQLRRGLRPACLRLFPPPEARAGGTCRSAGARARGGHGAACFPARTPARGQRPAGAAGGRLRLSHGHPRLRQKPCAATGAVRAGHVRSRRRGSAGVEPRRRRARSDGGAAGRKKAARARDRRAPRRGAGRGRGQAPAAIGRRGARPGREQIEHAPGEGRAAAGTGGARRRRGGDAAHRAPAGGRFPERRSATWA